MKNAITLKNISFRYKENSEYIFQNFSLNVEKGKWLAILGHNGSGKSTLSKIMTGLVSIDSGVVEVFGKELNNSNAYEIRKNIGVVFQNPDSQFVGASVEDDIAFGLENHFFKPQEMEKIIIKQLKSVGMTKFMEAKPHNLSGGQKQRVAIAGVLAISPKIIIFDESTSMLDPKGIKDINTIIKGISQDEDITIITITHNMDEAIFADRIVIIENGIIKEDGTPKEVMFNKHKLETLKLKPPFIAQVSNKLYKQGIIKDKTLSIKELISWL